MYEAEGSAVLPVKASGEPGDESQPCTVIPLGLQSFSSTRSVRRDAPAVVRDTQTCVSNCHSGWRWPISRRPMTIASDFAAPGSPTGMPLPAESTAEYTIYCRCRFAAPGSPTGMPLPAESTASHTVGADLQLPTRRSICRSLLSRRLYHSYDLCIMLLSFC